MSLQAVTWQEAAAGSLWLVGVAGLIGLGPQLPALELVILWLVLLVGLLIVLRRFWVWLLGPLFFYDLVRTARRNRLIPIRCVYATTLMVLLLYYGSTFASGFQSGEDLLSPESLPPNRLAKVANGFFTLFMFVQFIGVFALAPIFTAGAIVEEKEKRTYDLLLTTGLTNWEIVFGLLASRLANMGMVLLTGLPIICFLEFLGGIEPEAVLGNFLLTALLLLNLGCLSILTSAYAQSTLGSILKAYLYSWLLWGCLLCLPLYGIILEPAAKGQTFQGWALVGAASGFFSLFFLFIAVIEARQQGEEPAAPPSPNTPRLLGDISIENLPRTHLEADADRNEPVLMARPPVGNSPMMWKETYLRSWGVPSLGVTVFGCVILGIICLIICLAFSLPGISLAMTQEVLKNLALLITGLSLVPVGLAAARSVTEEREKKTLDPLAATPLGTKEILYAKWVGSIFGLRWVLIALAAFLLLASCGGAIHPLAFALLLIAWVVYACFFSCLGMFFSTISRTTLQATIFTGLAIIASVLGTFADERTSQSCPDMVAELIRALSPAANFRVLVFGEPFEGDGAAFTFALSLLLYIPITLGLWNLTARRFNSTFRNGQ